MKTALACLLLLLPAKKPDTIYLRDDSDWWSKLSILLDTEGETQETPVAVLKIAGVSLDQQSFSTIPAIVGQTVAVSRGDASTGRKQYCYASSDRSAHLVFEEGEVYHAYYLFARGNDWNGSKYCSKSEALSAATSNAAGVHLGMSPAEVQAILGKPLIADPRTLIYLRQTKRPFSTQPYAYDVVVHIEARFSGSKLMYLAVVKSEID
jgi:hypothetical protein